MMEWWNHGEQEHGILEEWNIGRMVFQKRRITQPSTIPAFPWVSKKSLVFFLDATIHDHL